MWLQAQPPFAPVDFRPPFPTDPLCWVNVVLCFFNPSKLAPRHFFLRLDSLFVAATINGSRAKESSLAVGAAGRKFTLLPTVDLGTSFGSVPLISSFPVSSHFLSFGLFARANLAISAKI